MKVFISEFLLPGHNVRYFKLFSSNLLRSNKEASKKGCPTKEFLTKPSKYLDSNGNNNNR
jgi:hypothetical protein